MELQLYRQYFPNGTNGKLFNNNTFMCETIELPWRNNKRSISCIPEGRYRIRPREHPKHGHQLEIVNVPLREAILIHPANFALRELQGCIAPVTKCTAPGIGNYSKLAMKRVELLVKEAVAADEPVFITIRS
ncbi:hypothetical protein C3K47_10945 [Solitalea longa]|uniref:DUF5675 domain-containing protein n=1 Tax=Solitalea longa TaxID=2079460 RepID=A0A2S5A159_9SPHI|nr:DUF5675 family protein [Solitalea longa]POY36264.1 hypothetical protein C3K47_10945 [Solitalea longa]